MMEVMESIHHDAPFRVPARRNKRYYGQREKGRFNTTPQSSDTFVFRDAQRAPEEPRRTDRPTVTVAVLTTQHVWTCGRTSESSPLESLARDACRPHAEATAANVVTLDSNRGQLRVLAREMASVHRNPAWFAPLLAALVCFLQLSVHSARAAAPLAPILTTDPIDGEVTTLVLDPARQERFLYYGTRSFPSSIVRVALDTHTRAGSIVCDPNDDRLLSSAIVDCERRLFVGTAVGTILRVDLPSFSRNGTLRLSRGGAVRALVADGTGTWLFACADGGHVTRVVAASFAEDLALQLNPGEDIINAAVLQGYSGTLYLGLGTTPGRVVRVRTADMSRTGQFDLNPGEAWVISLLIDPVHEDLIMSTSNHPGTVVKMRLADMQRTGSVSFVFLYLEDAPYAAVLDAAGEYAYFGCLTSPSKVVKVRLSTMDRADDVVSYGYSGSDFLSVAALDPVTNSAYFGGASTPGSLLRLNLRNFSVDATLTQTLTTSASSIVSLAIDAIDGFIYAGDSFHQMHKLRLGDMTRVASLAPVNDHGVFAATVVDHGAGLVYSSTNKIPPSVLQVRARDFTLQGAVLLPSSVYNRALLMHTGRQELYALDGANPAHIDRISLNPLAQTGSVTLPAVGLLAMNAVLDEGRGYIYVAFLIAPSVIGRVNVATFAVDLTQLSDRTTTPQAIALLGPGLLGFACSAAEGALVVTVRPGDPASEAVVVLPSDVQYLSIGAYDDAGGDFYLNALLTSFGGNSGPAISASMVRYNVASGRILGRYPLRPEDAMQAKAFAVDSATGMGYFSLNAVPGEIVRLRVADMTLDSRRSLAVPAPEGPGINGIIDSGYLFMLGGRGSSVLTRISLADFSRVDSAVLSRDVGPQTVVHDDTGHVGYFVLGDRVVRMQLPNMTVTGEVPLPARLHNPRVAVFIPTASSIVIGNFNQGTRSWLFRVDTRGGNATLAENVTLPLYQSYHTVALADTTRELVYIGTYIGCLLSVDPRSLAVRGFLGPSSGQTAFVGAVMDASATYAWFGTYTDPGVIIKVELESFSRVGSVTLLPGENRVTCGGIDSSGVFGFFGTAPEAALAPIVQINLDTMERVGALWPRDARLMTSATIDASSDAMYLSSFSFPYTVDKINISASIAADAISSRFTSRLALAPGEGEGWLRAGITYGPPDGSGPHAFFGSQLSPGLVISLRVADMHRVDSLTLPSGEEHLTCAAVDTQTGRGYFGTASTPGVIVQVALHNPGLQRLSSLVLPPGVGKLSFIVVQPSGQYLLAGASVIPGIIVRVALSNFSVDRLLTLGPGADEPSCGVLDGSGQFLFVGTRTAPGRIITVRVADMTQQAELALQAGHDFLRAAAVDVAAGLVLWGTGTTPSRILVMNVTAPSTPQLSQVVTLRDTSEAGVVACVADSSAGYAYCITDSSPPVIVQLSLRDAAVSARYTLSDLTVRPAGMLLSPGQPSVLLVTTSALPSRVMQLQATPPVPVLQRISTGGTDSPAPGKSLCLSLPLQPALPCVFAAESLVLEGQFEGHFVAPGRMTALLAVRVSFSLSGSGVWTSTPLPAAQSLACTSVTCPDGGTCVCSVSADALAALSQIGETGASNSSQPAVQAVQVEATVAMAGRPSAPLPFVMMLQSPRIVRCNPAVIASHGVLLTIEGAFERPFDNSTDRIELQPAASPSLPAELCSVVALSPDGQTITCRPPVVQQRLLGTSFHIVLKRGGSIAAMLAAALQYAWPTFAAVYPLSGLSPVGSPPVSPFTLQSAALMPWAVAAAAAGASAFNDCPSESATPSLRAWVGSTECLDVSYSALCSGTVTLTPPAGAGVGVPVTVEVAGGYNVSSFESLPAGAASNYDGQYALLPTPPKLGLRTSVDYALSTATSLSPLRWLLTPDADTLHVVLGGSALPPTPAVTLLFGDSVNCSMVTAADASAASCELQASSVLPALLRWANSTRALRGSTELPVSVRYHVPGWPLATAVVAPLPGLAFTFVGAPRLDTISPTEGKSGTTLVLQGSGFGLPGDPISVWFSLSVPCQNVSRISDSEVHCAAPTFDFEAFGSSATVSVVVRTGAGDSLPTSFTYSHEIRIQWATAPAAAGAITMPSVAPLNPVPTLRVVFGVPLSCWLVPQEAAVAVAGAAELPVALGQQAVSFQGASLAWVGGTGAALHGFNATLLGACRNGDTVVYTPTAWVWPVVAPSLQWGVDTLTALSSRTAFVPSTSDLPPVQALLRLPPSTSAAQVTNATALLSCEATLALVGATIPVSAAPGVFGVCGDMTSSLEPGTCALNFPGLSLAAAPLGASLLLAARCVWQPSQAVEQLPALPLQVVHASLLWLHPPPVVTESQSYLSPMPTVRLVTDAALPAQQKVECLIDASKVSASGATAAAAVSANGTTDSGGSGLATTDSVVIAQRVTGTWDAVLGFDSCSISGRRQARYNVTVVCTLGAQALPPIYASTEIAGCPPGKEPGGSTGWLCNDCRSGTWSDGGSMPCVSCLSDGASCSGGVLQLQPGYFLSPQQAAAPLGPATVLFPCFNSEACAVNATARSYGCRTELGYAADGPLCGVCADGYALFGQVCARCWPAWSATLLLVALVSVVVAAAVWLAIWQRPGARSPSSIAFRQLLGYLQLLSVVSAFRVQAMALMHSVLGWTDAANVSLLSFGPLSCLLPSAFVTRYLVTLLIPLLFGLLVAAILFIARLRRKHAVLAAANGRTSPASASTAIKDLSASRSAPATPAESTAADETAAAGDGTVKQRLISSVLMICSLLYMPLLTASLRALDCYEQPIDGVTYLRVDLRVQCNTSSHAAVQAVAWSVIVGLGVGFPAVICFVLMRRPPRGAARLTASTAVVVTGSGDTAEPAGVSVVWRPLYDGYSKGRGTLWWEAVVLLRKAVLALVGSLLAGGTRGIACFAFVLVVCVLLQETVRPYEEPRFNISERLVLTGALATAVLALLYSPEGATSPGNVTVTAAVLVITLLVLLHLFVQLLRASRGGVAERLRRLHTFSVRRLLKPGPALTSRARDMVLTRVGRAAAPPASAVPPAPHSQRLLLAQNSVGRAAHSPIPTALKSGRSSAVSPVARRSLAARAAQGLRARASFMSGQGEEWVANPVSAWGGAREANAGTPMGLPRDARVSAARPPPPLPSPPAAVLTPPSAAVDSSVTPPASPLPASAVKQESDTGTAQQTHRADRSGARAAFAATPATLPMEQTESHAITSSSPHPPLGY